MIIRSIAIIASLFVLNFSELAQADVSVRGYYRRDGTYVQPHHRSDPDGNSYNNWSSIGNVNPYTGEPGNKIPGYNKYERGGSWSQNTPPIQNPTPRPQTETLKSDYYKVNVIRRAQDFFEIENMKVYFKTNACFNKLINNEVILKVYTTGELAHGEVLFDDGTICAIEGLYK